MAKFPGKSRHSKPRTHNFLCCFGFSGKVDQFKAVKPGHERRRKRFFSWIRFRNSPPVTGTAPLPANSSLLGKTSEFYRTFPAEPDMVKADPDRLASQSAAVIFDILPPAEDRTVEVATAIHRASEENGEPVKVKHSIVAEKTIFESCELPNTPKKPTGQTSSRFSFSRKLESIPGRFPPAKKNLKSTGPVPAISLSLPPPPPNPNPTRNYQVEDPVTVPAAGKANGGMRKKYGPMAGIWIVMMTLGIMLLWGRLCAILCTAAWFYVVTGLRSSGVEKRHGFIELSESDSYTQEFRKKLVILRGFLERNRPGNLDKTT